jgi:epoxyqueuosine reductase
MDKWKVLIRQRARELGFAACGITTAAPLEHFSVYEQWIGAGRHAGMRYLSEARALLARADPARLLPSARSVIVLAASYPPPAVSPASPLQGRLAAYALGDDYHDVLRDRLRALRDYLDSLAGRSLDHRVFTDSGPVLEREIASRAGLGWIGRNSMLIHPDLGSFFFLAEIFTELALPPDPPFSADRCGACDRCRRACPAGCILPDRTVDSRRCVSYLTIEHRGSIPEELRGSIGRSIFGCDVCQTVCPWNRKAAPTTDAAFQPRAHFPIRNMTAELSLSEAEWSGRFRRSALRRAGRDGYLRNLLIALGNSHRAEALPALRTMTGHPNPVLREAAEWAEGQILSKKA